ncbi:amidase family protein, partial [Porticoccaceae bacterium]|nr:amidase family protein [Porticoccaceae bacterium]
QALEGLMLADMPALLAQVEKVTGKSAEESGLLTQALIDLGRFATGLKPDAKEQGLSWFQGLTHQLEQEFFSQYDVWLTPTMLTEAPEIGFIGPDTPFEIARVRNHSLMSYTALANGIGAPAMSVPLFTSTATGLPIGSQFMAERGNDKLLYSLAFELEEAKPWATRWAPMSAKFL